jgi:hypothetical protein
MMRIIQAILFDDYVTGKVDVADFKKIDDAGAASSYSRTYICRTIQRTKRPAKRL